MAALTAIDTRLLAALEDGLPFVSRPFADVGASLGLSEAEVVARLAALRESGTIKRFGLVVRHHELGYRANAMVVWDIPDREVTQVGRLMGTVPFVTLCYRRPRRPPSWPYNLFCMIHGQDRRSVRSLVHDLADDLSIADRPREILFSRRRFKQRGARFGESVPAIQSKRGTA